jgi:RNA polymerase sigma-70 factor (ECF subfamily)
MTEDGLPRRTSSDEKSAVFEQFRRQYYGLIWSRCMRLLANRDLADEACQETFLRAWQYLNSYDSKRSCGRPWLIGIQVNVCRDVLDDNRRIPTQPLNGEEASLVAPEDVEEFPSWGEALIGLPAPHGPLVEAWLACSGNVERIARQMRVSEGAVRCLWGRLLHSFYPLIGWGTWMEEAQPLLELFPTVAPVWIKCQQQRRPELRVRVAVPGESSAAIQEYLSLESSKARGSRSDIDSNYWKLIGTFAYFASADCGVIGLKDPASTEYPFAKAVALEVMMLSGHMTAKRIGYDPYFAEMTQQEYARAGRTSDAERVKARSEHDKLSVDDGYQYVARAFALAATISVQSDIPIERITG